MKKSSLILAIIFLISMGSLQRIEAQDSRKVEKEKQVQEAIDAQKKAMVEQQKAQEDARKALEDQKIVIEKAFKDAPMGQEEREKFDQAMKMFENSKGARNYHSPDPYVIGYGFDFNRRNFGEDTEGTNWEFSKYFKETSFSRDYTFDVEQTVNTVVMSVNGDCKAGEIRIKIVMPNGKTYSDIVIDEFGNLNWRKSFNISETENKDKTGAWTFEIKSSKASGFFKISLQTY